MNTVIIFLGFIAGWLLRGLIAKRNLQNLAAKKDRDIQGLVVALNESSDKLKLVSAHLSFHKLQRTEETAIN